jgi:uncharacterized protein (DUF2062 family)
VVLAVLLALMLKVNVAVAVELVEFYTTQPQQDPLIIV